MRGEKCLDHTYKSQVSRILCKSKKNVHIRTQGVTKSLSSLTNSALVYEPKWGGGGRGVAGSQPMSAAVHMEPEKNFGDITSYLTYIRTHSIAEQLSCLSKVTGTLIL
jgi:hypothetical protein